MRNRILLFIILAFMVSCNNSPGDANSRPVSGSDTPIAGTNISDSQPQPATGTAIKNNVKTPGLNQLTGDWLRTDGGKTIRIKNAMPEGKLDAEYFNPKSIHVGRAEWLVKNNSLVVIVELQDVNYPGSRYTLEYLPDVDELAGIYYQAVEKVSYDVGFVRQK